MASRTASSLRALAPRLPTPFSAQPLRRRFIALAGPRPRGVSPLRRELRALRCAHSIPRPAQPTTGATSKAAAPREAAAADDAAAVEPDSSAESPQSESPRPEKPNPAYYQISFTCVPCGHRSHHNVSKQAYHTGSTLITCPSCRNRHVISDHLNIFGDRKITVEDLMREKGRLVKRGTLGEDGDIEFWPDEPNDAPSPGTEPELAAPPGSGKGDSS